MRGRQSQGRSGAIPELQRLRRRRFARRTRSTGARVPRGVSLMRLCRRGHSARGERHSTHVTAMWIAARHASGRRLRTSGPFILGSGRAGAVCAGGEAAARGGSTDARVWSLWFRARRAALALPVPRTQPAGRNLEVGTPIAETSASARRTMGSDGGSCLTSASGRAMAPLIHRTPMGERGAWGVARPRRPSQARMTGLPVSW
jgi:hypothetical protein